MLKNLKMRESIPRAANYEDYIFSRREWMTYVIEGFLMIGIIGYFFYRSFPACFLLAPLMFFFLKEKKKELAKRRKQELNMQFKDAVLSVSANQKAGYSVENAFREAYKDMAMLYGAESYICKELNYIAKGLDNNIVLEKLLFDFGVRSHVQDILQFADVFLIAKRSGGNMTEILSKTADTIEQKIAVDKEIEVLLSSKKMEQKIMNVIPFFIIFYIGITSKGFFDVMYHNPAGILIMTICLIIYLAAFKISEKIVAIEI